MTDEDVFNAIKGDGPLHTYVVAARIRADFGLPKRPTTATLRALKRLEKANRVRRVARYSYVNSISWIATEDTL